jgi:hypothetical protein
MDLPKNKKARVLSKLIKNLNEVEKIINSGKLEKEAIKLTGEEVNGVTPIPAGEWKVDFKKTAQLLSTFIEDIDNVRLDVDDYIEK